MLGLGGSAFRVSVSGEGLGPCWYTGALGFRGSGFRNWGLGFRVQGSRV